MGKRITSSILSLFKSTINSRSIPRAMPADGCLMDFRLAMNCSSMGNTLLLRLFLSSCSSFSRWVCSSGSMSSEKALAIS